MASATASTPFPFIVAADPLSLVRDHRAKEALTAQGIAVRSFNADLLYEPWKVHDDEGHPFTTFAAFWDRCLSMPYDPESPLLPPKRITSGLYFKYSFEHSLFQSFFPISCCTLREKKYKGHDDMQSNRNTSLNIAPTYYTCNSSST